MPSFRWQIAKFLHVWVAKKRSVDNVCVSVSLFLKIPLQQRHHHDWRRLMWNVGQQRKVWSRLHRPKASKLYALIQRNAGIFAVKCAIQDLGVRRGRARFGTPIGHTSASRTSLRSHVATSLLEATVRSGGAWQVSAAVVFALFRLLRDGGDGG